MTTGTKIFLAVFAAFVGVLVVYYGVLLPEAQNLPALSPATSVAGQPPAARGMESTAPLADMAAANTNSILGSDPAGLTSSGGFKFDLPVPTTNEPGGIEPASNEVTPVQHAAIDPLASESPQPSPAQNPQPASSNEPTQPVNQVVVSPPVANQPVTLPGASRLSRATPPPTSDYVVKSGDTMSSIAAEWFGDANKWSLIAKENPNIDPARLSVGQKLRLPPKDAKPATVSTVVKEQTPSPSPSTETTYTVRSGDTLAKIAREYLGDVSKWKLIYDANRKTIGSDPAALKPGMKLKLPSKT